MTTSTDTTAEVLATLRASIERMRAVLASPAAADVILAWDNGLAVCWNGPAPTGHPGICSIEGAPPIVYDERRPSVRNGAGELALARLRSTLLVNEIEKLEPLVAQFEALAS